MPQPGPAGNAPRRRLLVVHNPTAGRRRRRFLRRVLDRLGARGATAATIETRAAGHAETIARDMRAADYDAIVAAGGDGTINEIVNGLAGRDIALGIVPVGTGNVLAAELALPADEDAVAGLLAQGGTRRIHLGEVGGRLFTMMAGLGFDAHVVDSVHLGLKRRVGKLAYVATTLSQMARWDSQSYRVVIDGIAFDCASAIAANGHYYGGRFVAAPAARLDAPSLDVVLFERPGPRAALRYAVALACGQLNRLGDVRVVRGREISVTAAGSDEPVQADGDIVARLPVTIRVAEATQRVIAP
ncbi:MAG: diacylglycerol kinase family lipid kinase [Alphaproteobacteria bacterium]|nr:diacylglycerol kinase family lipid kinase [Alphaproteobacteria bacterium]